MGDRKWERENGTSRGYPATPPGVHLSVICPLVILLLFFFLFFFFFLCVSVYHPLTARPGLPAYIGTGEVQSHTHAHVKNADGMYMCRVCVCVCVCVSDMFVRGPLGQECSTRGSRKGSSALLRSPGSLTYSAAREREREGTKCFLFSRTQTLLCRFLAPHRHS